MALRLCVFSIPVMRQDGESPLGGEPGLAGGSANSALPARAALGAPFCETGRAVVGGAVALTAASAAPSFISKALGMRRRPAGRWRIGFCFQTWGCICWEQVDPTA